MMRLPGFTGERSIEAAGGRYVMASAGPAAAGVFRAQAWPEYRGCTRRCMLTWMGADTACEVIWEKGTKGWWTCYNENTGEYRACMDECYQQHL